MGRIFLVTPLRNEIDNLPQLVDSVAAQTISIDLWVIVENGSTDGSREALAQLGRIPTVKQLVVLNIDTEEAEYQLGAKYARIVARGFREITERVGVADSDFIGILDADSFPAFDYYERLVAAFARLPGLGITSGLSFNAGTGRPSGHSATWVRGSCRLWRGACFLQSGYILGPSADTLSAARAVLDGWEVSVTKEAAFQAREVGERSKFEYYGKSAYFRGHTLAYAILRSGKSIVSGSSARGWGFLMGYVRAMCRREARLEDMELRRYFRQYGRLLFHRYLFTAGR